MNTELTKGKASMVGGVWAETELAELGEVLWDLS